MNPTTEDEIWTTKTGQRIKVADMSEEHAKNALRMLLRKARRIEENSAEFSVDDADCVIDGCDRYGSLQP